MISVKPQQASRFQPVCLPARPVTPVSGEVPHGLPPANPPLLVADSLADTHTLEFKRRQQEYYQRLDAVRTEGWTLFFYNAPLH